MQCAFSYYFLSTAYSSDSLKEHYTQATSGIMGIIIYNRYNVLSPYTTYFRHWNYCAIIIYLYLTLT